jgi:hypothetical protein
MAAQTVTLTDETQTCTVGLAAGYPVLYSGDTLLRQSILWINDLHAVEPIDTIAYAADTDPYVYKLTVTLLDGRIVVYHFETVDPDTELFTMVFTGATWEETSLDLLNILKNGILTLNKAFPMSDSDTFAWESI